MTATLAILNARILTMGDRPGAKRGPSVGDLGIIGRGAVIVEGGKIRDVIAGDPDRAYFGPGARVIDARGRVVMPGFIDAHTHALWAGDRIDEFEAKLAGATYLEILGRGGGIMSTVRAVRAATDAQLADLLRARLRAMVRGGTLTVEVKSGYGLSTTDELKMLRVIGTVAREADRDATLPHITATALLGHAIDPAEPDFIGRTIGETLDAVHAEFPGITVDAFCEKGAWSVEDCSRLFERAASLGHPFRVHADQFNELGMARWAAEHGALSIDHLEATSKESLRELARSGSFGVMLPACGFHLDGRYADGRAFLDASGLLAIATNCNPGSAPGHSMPFVVALAVRHLRITAAAAIGACTVNGAALVGLADRGVVAAGARADLIMLGHTDERALGYEFGGNPVEMVVRGGEVVVCQT